MKRVYCKPQSSTEEFFRGLGLVTAWKKHLAKYYKANKARFSNNVRFSNLDSYTEFALRSWCLYMRDTVPFRSFLEEQNLEVWSGDTMPRSYFLVFGNLYEDPMCYKGIDTYGNHSFTRRLNLVKDRTNLTEHESFGRYSGVKFFNSEDEAESMGRQIVADYAKTSGEFQPLGYYISSVFGVYY